MAWLVLMRLYFHSLFIFLLPIWTISCFTLYFYKQVTSKNILPIARLIHGIQFSVPTTSLQSLLCYQSPLKFSILNFIPASNKITTTYSVEDFSLEAPSSLAWNHCLSISTYYFDCFLAIYSRTPKI